MKISQFNVSRVTTLEGIHLRLSAGAALSERAALTALATLTEAASGLSTAGTASEGVTLASTEASRHLGEEALALASSAVDLF